MLRTTPSPLEGEKEGLVQPAIASSGDAGHFAPGLRVGQQGADQQVVDGVAGLVAFVAAQQGRAEDVEVADGVQRLVPARTRVPSAGRRGSGSRRRR